MKRTAKSYFFGPAKCLLVAVVGAATSSALPHLASAQAGALIEICSTNGNTINVRAGPGTDHAVIASLENATSLQVIAGNISNPEAWLQVQLGDVYQNEYYNLEFQGYVLSRLTVPGQCQVLHDPAVAGLPASRVGAQDLTLGPWDDTHDLFLQHWDHPQMRRVYDVGMAAIDEILLAEGMDRGSPYPNEVGAEEEAFLAAPDARIETKRADGSDRGGATGGKTVTENALAAPASVRKAPVIAAAPGGGPVLSSVMASGRQIPITAGTGTGSPPRECFRRNEEYPMSTPLRDFMDNGDGTVTHQRTGLTWYRCPVGQYFEPNPRPHHQYCESGGPQSRGIDNATAPYDEMLEWVTALRIGGRTWRLPTAEELLSIVEPGCHSPMINQAAFPGSIGQAYWTSTVAPWDSSMPDRQWVRDRMIVGHFSNPSGEAVLPAVRSSPFGAFVVAR